MHKGRSATFLFVLLVLSAFVAGCGAAEQSAPSADEVATQVAQEIFATLTAQAVAQVVTATPVAVAPTDTSSPIPTTPPTDTPTPTVTPTRKPTNTARPTNTPRPTLTPTPRPGIGSVVRCGNLWEVSVIAPPSMAKRINVLDTAGYLTFSDADAAKGQWLLLLFDLTNLQLQTDSLSWLSDELAVRGRLDGRSVTFEPSDWGTSRAQRSQGISNWGEDVPPGITIRALAIFDINPEATDLELVIKGESDYSVVCEAGIFLEDASVPEGVPVAVASNVINVRTGPGTNYPVAGQTRSGQRLEITGRNSDATWLKVRFDGSDAWVAASVAPPSGSMDEIAIVTDIPAPPTPPATPTPRATPTPLSRERSDQESVVQIWGIRLYDAKRAKVVYFFGDAEIATGTWLIPFVQLRNAGSGTADPLNNLTFYLQDSQGRTFDFDPFNDAVLGAAWQFQAGHLYDDINPGLALGVALPFDVPPDLGDVWLRVEEAPGLAWYVGNVSQMAETQ